MATNPKSYEEMFGYANDSNPDVFAQEFGGYGDSSPFSVTQNDVEPDDFWLTDGIEGIGLGVLGAVEGILELGTIIPGIDYDIPDNFGLGHAETGFGKFMEGTTAFFAPFLVPGAGWVAKGAHLGKLGKGAQATRLLREGSKISKAAGAIQGGTFKLGKHIAGEKLQLTKFTNQYLGRDWLMARKALHEGATGLGKMKGMGYAAAGKMVGQFPEMMGAGIGGAIVDFSVWDPHEDRLSNFIQEIPGLANPVNEFLAADEEDSELLGRIKQTLEGFGMGFAIDGFIGGIKALFAAKRVYQSTGDSAKAARAFRKEKIENDVSRWAQQFNGDRETAIHGRMFNLGLDPERINFETVVDDVERQLFQLDPHEVPENLRGLLSPDDLSQLTLGAVRDVSDLVETSLNGGLDPVVLRELALAGQAVRGEYERMGSEILPALFPAQAGRTKDDGVLWTALNAILSPNQQVDTHTGASMMVLSAWRAAGRPTRRAEIKAIITDALGATGADSTSLEGMLEHQKRITKLLENADALETDSQILDYVNTKLIKTREFAGGYLPGRFSGIALDVHMGHILDSRVWKEGTTLYNKTFDKYQGTGATAYRAIIRKTADELGWKSGTEVQETVWSSIAAIKGLLQHFRGNVDDVLDNMHGELITQLWDHNVVLKELMENERFASIMKAGGASDDIISNMKNGEGVFAPREVTPGVADFDREAVRKAVNHIQQFTSAGSASGAPGRMLNLIRAFGQEAAERLGLSAPGMSYQMLRGTGLRRTGDQIIDGKKVKLPGTQKGKGILTVDYRDAEHGLPDTYKFRELIRPEGEQVAGAATGAASKVVGAAVDEGKAVSVVYDTSAAKVVRTPGGGKPLSTRDAVTLTDVSFEVGGKKPALKGAYKEGEQLAEGVAVKYDGTFFVTENGYAVRNADEVTMAGDKMYARGKVTYWDQEAAFGVQKSRYRKIRLPELGEDGKPQFALADKNKLDSITPKAYAKLPPEEKKLYTASLDSKDKPHLYYKADTLETRPDVLEGLEDQSKTMGYKEGISAPPSGVPIGRRGVTKFLFQNAEEGVERAKGATVVTEAGRLYMMGFENADASTGLHELIHAWRLIGVNRALPEADRVAMGGLRDFEVDALEKAMGMKPGDEWTDELDERLAAYWEKYVWEGQLPKHEGVSDRDFDVINVAFTKLSKKQREVYEGYEGSLTQDAIPEEIRNLFDGAVNRSNVQETMDSLGDEALALYGQALSATGRVVTRTKVEEAVDKFEAELSAKYPDYKEGLAFKTDAELRAVPAYQALTQGEKIKLGRRRAEWKRQQDAINTAAEGVHTRAQQLHDAKGQLNAVYDDLNAKYDEGWSDLDLEEADLLRVHRARAALAKIESGKVPFASRAAEPTRQGGKDAPETGFPGARREPGMPVNVGRAVRMEGEGGIDDIASADDAKDLFEQYVRAERDLLDPTKPHAIKEADAEWVAENERRYYLDVVAATRKGGKADLEKFFDKNTDVGREFMARSRAIRAFSADVFASATEAEARLAAAEAAGVIADIDKAKADLLYWTGLFEPVTDQLMSMSQLKGSGLKDMATEPWAVIHGRPTSPETVKATLEATTAALQGARGVGEDVDAYIERLRVAMREGQLSTMSVATKTNGDRLDTVLEVFYNSLLSGPRTHAVNTLSNSLYGLMMHGSRALGRKGLTAAGLTDEFAWKGGRASKREVLKMTSTVVGLRQILKDSFALARVALKEGAAQYDQTGGRAAFDSSRGVFTGKTSRDFEGRLKPLGEDRELVQPLKSLFNGLFRTISLDGWPTRLLGGMDEAFKQMHSRLVVSEALIRQGAEKFPNDARAIAEYVQDEFATIIGDGNHYTLKRVKRDGLREAAEKGLDKSAARRYMQEYVKNNWSEERSALAEKALEFSRRSTFTTPANKEAGRNLISREIHHLGKAMQDFTGQVRWLRFLVPFINTPTNLMAEAADMLASPLTDGVLPGWKKMRSRLSGDVESIRAIENPEEAADALGRLAMSSSIISLVWMKANSGEITGGGPKDPDAQRLLREAGWQPYSIRFGDTYYGYGRLDPIASVMGIVADIAEGFNGNPYTDNPEEEGIKALMMGATMAVFRNLGEKSYLSGMINFASAIDNPEYYGKQVTLNMGGSMVPTLSAQVAGQMDPTLREVRGIVDKWKVRIPGLGDDLLPKRNFMGEPVGKMQHMGGPLLGLFSPIPVSQVSSDIVATEAAKFGEVMGPPDPVKFGTLDLREYGAYDRYQELQGEVLINGANMRQGLEELIESAEYGSLPDFAGDGASSPKMDLLRKAVTKYRGQAWKELLKEFPMLKENFDITMYNRGARKGGRPERDLLDLLR
tara:strand:+ start:13345 stop:20358 length:7014 start_codon:yes stop_codon:yes gene_type:complete